jgi:hypothetical protein
MVVDAAEVLKAHKAGRVTSTPYWTGARYDKLRQTS